ncbi:MAG: MaoC/PaaZ C-terminal domain-containing protein [Actinomycetota bacterium]|nr:MaoC/PaaZ C-terminal domain-containing protein [Actinomycetota bacterium]
MTDSQGAAYTEYIGREERSRDSMAPESAIALAALLGREATGAELADLPAVWHWVYFHRAYRPGDLGPDGHLRRGEASVVPPVPARRRMYAGGSVTLLAPLSVGALAEKTTICTKVERKAGRSGDLVFVTLEHRITQDGELARVEEQSLVFFDPPPATYRPFELPPLDGEAGAISLGAREAGNDGGFLRHGRLQARSPMLFTYSALTGNPHKIHYDRSYCQQFEGYPGLVVHGPLLASAALEAVLGVGLPRVGSFEFRARSPIFEGQEAEIHARQDGDTRISIEITCGGDLCMTASAMLAG